MRGPERKRRVRGHAMTVAHLGQDRELTSCRESTVQGHCAWINSLSSPGNPVIKPIIQMRKLRPREVRKVPGQVVWTRAAPQPCSLLWLPWGRRYSGQHRLHPPPPVQLPHPPLAPNSQLSILLRVEAHGLDGGHHHDHAQRDRHKQHDHVLCPIFESQLLLQARRPPRNPTADVAVSVLVLMVLLTLLASLWETMLLGPRNAPHLRPTDTEHGCV